MPILAPQWWPFERWGSKIANFWQRKWKVIAKFSATTVGLKRTVHLSWWAVGFAPYLWSVKKVETALLSEGQASGTSCQVALVDSSHFVDRNRVVNGRRAVCDCAKLLYKSLKMKGALLPTIRTMEIFVRFSDIRIFANIRTIRFNPRLRWPHVCLSLSLSHRVRPAHNIPSASALGIIFVNNNPQTRNV